MRNRMLTRWIKLIVTVAAVAALSGLSTSAFAAQAGGAISLIASSPNLTEGAEFNVVVRITNTSSEDLDNGGDVIDAVYSAGGAINVILACTTTECTTQLPGTLEFLSCPSAQTGVTCAAVGANGVQISVASDVNIPAGGISNIATMRLKAKTPVPTATGQFFQRADTGPNDLAAYSPIEDVTVTGGATGSRNFNFPPVCSVQLDKQISCDGGTTWLDVGFGDDVAQACTATDLTAIMVRYIVKNPSSTLTIGGCTLGESNVEFGTPGAVGPIGTGGEVIVPGTLQPLCMSAWPNEPNTATVSCTVCQDVQVDPPFGDQDSANLICEAVTELKVDRNVDCGPAGANSTGGSADGGLVKFNDDDTLGCKAFDGGTVEFEYVAKNESSRTLFDCTFVDTSAIVGANGTAYVLGDLAAGETKAVDSVLIPRLSQLCGDSLETSEVPDLGYLALECCIKNVDNITSCEEVDRVARYDISTVVCLSPGVELTKDCVDTNQDGRDDKVVLTTENTGEVDMTTCTLTDSLEGYGAIAVVPDEINNLIPGASVISEGVLPVLTADALNTATANCTAADGSTYERVATDTCKGWEEQEGCLTRTPGFWGTHPAVTMNYLPVTVCGTVLNTVDALSTTSAIEAVCSVGTDGKILGSQMTQLIRQCTAAALNLSATRALEGDCSNSTGSEDIEATYAACCGTASICTGDAVTDYDIGACIYSLDAFNNLPDDTLNFDYPIGSATPKNCQKSKNNGVVVSPTP